MVPLDQVRVEHLLPSATMIVAAGRARFLCRWRISLAAHNPMLAYAFSEHVAEALAMGDHLEQAIGSLDVAQLSRGPPVSHD
jgi:hypothetical protein